MESKFEKFISFEKLDINNIIDKNENQLEYNIISEYKNGSNKKRIQKKFNISKYMINQTFKKYNLYFRPSGNKPIDDKLFPEIIIRYNSGESSEKIAESLNINPGVICRMLKKNGIQLRMDRNKKYDKKEDWLSIIDCEAKAYFLGLILTDGNVSKKDNNLNITLQEPDSSILQKLSIEIFGKVVLGKYKINNKECKFGEKVYKTNYDSIALRVCSKQMKQDLEKYGIIPNKTFFTHYPPNIPLHLHKHVLRGIIDGDGHVGYKKIEGHLSDTRISLTGTKTLINGMENIFNNIF